MGDARHFAERKYPGDHYALLRWWCEASEGAAVQLAGLMAEVVELRAEVAGMKDDRDWWKALCIEANKEGQRAVNLCIKWQRIAEGRADE